MKALLGIVILVLDILAILDCLKSNKDAGEKSPLDHFNSYPSFCRIDPLLSCGEKAIMIF